MAFSYGVTQLANNPLYQVRLRLGDVSEESHQLEDEEIQYFLKANSESILSTCIACVTALLPRLASAAGFTVGPYTERGPSSNYAYWTRLLDELRAEASSYSAPIAHLPQTPTYFYTGMMGTPESSATDP